MTSTLSHHERLARDAAASHGDRTRNLTYLTQRPNLRRPDASGEFPLYRPASFGDVDRMARAALEATLVLPVGAEPAPRRRAVPTVYRPEPVRPAGYRGRRRMVEPPARWWAGLVVGACWAAALESAALIVALAVTR